MPRAIVLGCAGERLTADERRLFAAADPAGFLLFRRNCKDPDQVRALVAEMRDCVGRAEAPVLIDQEGGRVQRLQPPHWRKYPAPARIAALPDPDAEEAARLGARLIADDLAALGIDVDALPVLDLPSSGADPVIGDRAYGGDPERVARLGRAACEGLLAGGVLPIIKHIPGHGRAQVDSHRALPRVDAARDLLEKTDFAPFRALSDMPWAMTAHIVYTAIDPVAPATFSAAVIDGVIRKHIGFDGVLISDDISMGALDGSLAERTRRSLAAGCDLAMHCNGVLSEMEEVADATPPLTAAAQARLARAEALRRQSAQPFDRAAAEARFAELLGETVAAGNRASSRA
ncbi:MAG: beta-N-acetylhexosaminidase [Alphaproteobacteria bacterium]|nr:beta-N-acetylhexosaminidase [Alphaproteobacteria bacterium]MBV9154346.1 beta-N-acetylhexosaminidase [Alphaproteobacteria bacterium]